MDYMQPSVTFSNSAIMIGYQKRDTGIILLNMLTQTWSHSRFTPFVTVKDGYTYMIILFLITRGSRGF